MMSGIQLPAELEEQRQRVVRVMNSGVTSERFCLLLDGLVLMRYCSEEGVKAVNREDPIRAVECAEEIRGLLLRYISPLYNWIWAGTIAKKINDPLQSHVGRTYETAMTRLADAMRVRK
ncbi:MAG: hypothetical protein AABW80_01275 [Nanoarchaeota archaeon]